MLRRLRAAGMLIQLSIDTTQPLTGSASTDGTPPVPFVGWLEMLRVIADLTEAADTDTGGPAAAVDERPAPEHERDRSLS